VNVDCLSVFSRCSLTFCSLALSLQLVKQGDSLSNLLVKLCEIVEVSLDLINGQVDKHSSDLGASLRTDQLFYVLVDKLSYEVLVVRVFWDHDREVTITSHVVVIHNWVGVGQESLRDTRCGGCNDHNMLCVLHVHNRLLRNNVLHVALSGARSSLIVVVVVASSVLVVSVAALVASGTGTIVAVLVVVGAIEILRASIVVVVSWEEVHAATHLLLEQNEDLLNKLDGVGLLEKVRVNRGGSVLLSLVVEVGLVLGLSLQLLADLRQLVVFYIKLLFLDGLAVELSSREGCAVGLLEAHEGAARGRLVIVSREDLDALNLAKLLKLLAQFLFIELLREVLDE